MPLSVLLLDDDQDLREVLGELLALLGVGCVQAHSVASLVSQREAALRCAVAILDVNLGAGVASGLDAYRWLRDEGFAGKVLFLTGHARGHPLVASARDSGVEVMEKPIDIHDVQDLLARAQS
jgi:DNA-binding NtrC family response regulator